jgi:hypothetical protein
VRNGGMARCGVRGAEGCVRLQGASFKFYNRMCVLVSTGARLLPRQLRRLLMMLMLLMMLHLMMRQLMMLMLLLPMLLSRAQKRVQTDGPRRYAQSARCRFLRLQPARPAL